MPQKPAVEQQFEPGHFLPPLLGPHEPSLLTPPSDAAGEVPFEGVEGSGELELTGEAGFGTVELAGMMLIGPGLLEGDPEAAGADGDGESAAGAVGAAAGADGEAPDPASGAVSGADTGPEELPQSVVESGLPVPVTSGPGFGKRGSTDTFVLHPFPAAMFATIIAGRSLYATLGVGPEPAVISIGAQFW